MARRTEGMFGDQIVAHMRTRERGRYVRHVVLSVNHPVHTLANLIFEDARIVYLSFPISAPRKQLAQGAPAVRDQINAFHQRALAVAEANKDVVCISPLSIDELPLVESARPHIAARDAAIEAAAMRVREAKGRLHAVAADSPDRPALEAALETAKEALTDLKEKATWEFDFDPAAARWALDQIWPGRPLLSSRRGGRPPLPRRPIPTEAADNVLGLIATDVGWRDNRLVLQSDALAVFCPVVPREETPRVARGVRHEITRAMLNDINSFVYQDPTLDPTGAWTHWLDTEGSMGTSPEDELIHTAASVDALFADLLVSIRR